MDQHVIPVGDVKKHYLADYCWCHPEIIELDGGTIYNHNALDCRKVVEDAGITYKKWQIFNMAENTHGACVG